MDYSKLAKICDASYEKKEVTVDEVKNYMINLLKVKLDKDGITILYAGADRPGEDRCYCTKEHIQEALKKVFSNDVPEEDEFLSFDTDKKYICVWRDWNDTGDFGVYSEDDINEFRDNCTYWAKWATFYVNKYGVDLNVFDYSDSADEFIQLKDGYEDDKVLPANTWDEFCEWEKTLKD